MQFTQQEMLVQLKASGRKSWTLRQMTALRGEGYLPPLIRRTQQGTNKPRYVWSEEDLEQICDVYDCWRYYEGDRATLTLNLWLQGYAVPLGPLRRMYHRLIDEFLEHLTHGKTDPEDILFEASHVAFAVIRKFKYTPGLIEQRKKFNMEEMEPIIESIFGALAVPDPRMTGAISRSFLRSAGLAEEDVADDLEELLTIPEQIAAILHDIFTLPNLREVVQEATFEQWEQARGDYLTFCQRVSEWGEVSDASKLPDWFCRNLMIHGACWLIIPLLSTRYRGHGRWIDLAFEKMHEVFIDPSIQAKVHAGMRKRKLRRAGSRARDNGTALIPE